MAGTGANAPRLVHTQLFVHTHISGYAQQYVGVYCHTKGAMAVWRAAGPDAGLRPGRREAKPAHKRQLFGKNKEK